MYLVKFSVLYLKENLFLSFNANEVHSISSVHRADIKWQN